MAKEGWGCCWGVNLFSEEVKVMVMVGKRIRI